MNLSVRQRKQDPFFEIYNLDIPEKSASTLEEEIAKLINKSKRCYTEKLIKHYKGIPYKGQNINRQSINSTAFLFLKPVIVFRSPKDANKALEEYINPKLMIAHLGGKV